MSILDPKMTNIADVKSEVKKETIMLKNLPKSAEELIDLPDGKLTDPYYTAAFTVFALCEYTISKEAGIEILTYLKGPFLLSMYDKKLLSDCLRDKKYIPFSYLDGATPENSYKVQAPFKITVESKIYSFDEEGFIKLYVTSGGAQSPKPITIRRKDDQWFLWEQMLLSDISKPKNLNLWV